MDPVVHGSAAMDRVLALAERVAATDASVLITGESGTGKSFLAEKIHRLGRRRDGPFIIVPCANIPADLFESELFGHEAGSHTDAVSRRTGRFEAAHGGTLVLDGVETLDQRLQAKLLRAVQEKVFERLGGTETVEVDVRLISCADAGLETRARDGAFREDLFYRLNVVHLRLPPLRERIDDIGPLASHFLRLLERRHGGGRRKLSPEARRALKGYSWPGNIRELAGALERAVITRPTGVIEAGDLALGFGSPAEKVAREAHSKRWSLRALEAAYIEEVLREAGGNKSRAASILGISRKTLLEKLKRSGN